MTTYLCQQCGHKYSAEDPSIPSEIINCFCSMTCKDRYFARYGRWPRVGCEIPLGDPQPLPPGVGPLNILEIARAYRYLLGMPPLLHLGIVKPPKDAHA